jgi:hypothetical protein
MFRSTAIIRELVLSLAKVIFILKHSVKLRRYMLFDVVAACHRAHNTHTSLYDTLPHHPITYNDVILPSVFILT